MTKKWTVSKIRYVLKTPYMHVRKDRCTSFGGNKVDYYVIEKKNAVGVVAITDQNEVVLERQYRHPHKEWLVQIPAGHIEENEDPEYAVKRELLEETGYVVENLQKVNTFIPACAQFDNVYTLYIGTHAQQVKNPCLDKEEDIEVFTVPMVEAIDMVRRGEIKEIDTCFALYLGHEYLYKSAFQKIQEKIIQFDEKVGRHTEHLLHVVKQKLINAPSSGFTVRSL